MHQCAVSLNEKLSFVMRLIASTFVEIVTLILSIDFHSSLTKNDYQLYTAAVTVTDLVNIEHVDNRQQDPRSCLVHLVDRFDSERWFRCNQVIFNVFRVFLVKKACSI